MRSLDSLVRFGADWKEIPFEELERRIEAWAAEVQEDVLNLRAECEQFRQLGEDYGAANIRELKRAMADEKARLDQRIEDLERSARNGDGENQP